MVELLKAELWFKVGMDRDWRAWGEAVVMLPAVRHICVVLNVVTSACASAFYMKTRIHQYIPVSKTQTKLFKQCSSSLLNLIIMVHLHI